MSRKQKRAYESLKKALGEPRDEYQPYSKDSLTKDELFAVIYDLERELLSKDYKLAELNERVDYLLQNHSQEEFEHFVKKLKDEASKEHADEEKVNLLKNVVESARARNQTRNALEEKAEVAINYVENGRYATGKEASEVVAEEFEGNIYSEPTVQFDEKETIESIEMPQDELKEIPRAPRANELEEMIQRETAIRLNEKLNDEEFVQNNILNNDFIVAKVVAKYLASLGEEQGAVTLNSAIGRSALTPLAKPRNLREAKAIADKLFR
ncbi:MAG: hypothetical protein FWC11_03115 [Firmicutes bacterium]|nr:hypothetical protein [Bacillota bacterium]